MPLGSSLLGGGQTRLLGGFTILAIRPGIRLRLRFASARLARFLILTLLLRCRKLRLAHLLSLRLGGRHLLARYSRLSRRLLRIIRRNRRLLGRVAVGRGRRRGRLLAVLLRNRLRRRLLVIHNRR